MNKRDFVIIGGGVGGLSAALRLTELGVKPLLIEAGKYPSHKVCGEFLSSESIPHLKKWGLCPIEIRQAKFHTCSKKIPFCFSEPAGSLSHFALDFLLAELATQQGVEILTQTQVTDIYPGRPFHQMVLSSKETIFTPCLMIGTGRIPSYSVSPPPMRYLGIKAHFSGIDLKNTLEMFFFEKAYLGISPIEEGQVNVACLADLSIVKDGESTSAFIQHLTSKNPLLAHYLMKGKCLFSDWMTAALPSFGIKKVPNWPHTYFLGDAIGTIPPVTGNGLSMAILGGIMAAEYAIKNDAEGFKKAWFHRFNHSIMWGRLCHHAVMSPTLCKYLFSFEKICPVLIGSLFKLTR